MKMYIGGEDNTAKRVQKIYIGYNKKAKSLLKNSSFINDTDWTNNITYYSYSFEEDYATITVKKAPSTNGSYPTGQVAYNQVIEPRITGSDVSTMQKIYVCARIRSYSTNIGYPNVLCRVYVNGGTSYTNYSLRDPSTGTNLGTGRNDDTWRVIGRLISTYDVNTGDYCEIAAAGISIFSPSGIEPVGVGDKLDIKEVCFFNLTEIYGRGNEPSEEWCYANIIPNNDGIFLSNISNIAQQVKKIYIGDENGKAKLYYANAGEEELLDFDYKDNNDGTYTITDWKGTSYGLKGTEIIIPNAFNIIL